MDSVDLASTGDAETASNKATFGERMSSNGEVIGESGNPAEILTQLELDLACASEKLVNLNVLMMNVTTRESDVEAFASEKEHSSDDSLEKALEIDLLSGVLDSEARELDGFMAVLQSEVNSTRELLSSCTHMGENFREMEEMLRDSEQSLKQSQDQVSEIRMQSVKFQRSLSCLEGENNRNYDKGVSFSEDDQFLNVNTKIKMQTAEQQRHILRMLEKSLAREIDFEKKLTELRQIEEDLRQKKNTLEQEVCSTEEETTDVWERWFEADNISAVLLGISKELLGRLQILQLNLNSSVRRELMLRSKLEGSRKELSAKEDSLDKLESSSAEVNDILVAQTNNLKANLREAEDKLILANSEAFTLRDKVDSLEKQLKESEIQLLNTNTSVDGSPEQHTLLFSQVSEMENTITDLKENISRAESRADNAEAKCKLLGETNMELNEELGLLKSSAGASDKVDSLEKQLRESDIQLQHAIASAEASQEKQNLLYATINDMENVIKDLKLKVSKAESRADSAEDKCIMLSELHAELNEEQSFLRRRLECLEASLHQADETKISTAKSIDIQTKVITNLVMQLAFERERLHKQISSLAVENKILVLKLQESNKHPSVVMKHDNRGNAKEAMCIVDNKEEVTELSDIGSKLDKSSQIWPFKENKVAPSDFMAESEAVRRIDAGILNFKHVSLAVLVFLIAAAAAYCFQLQKCPF